MTPRERMIPMHLQRLLLSLLLAAFSGNVFALWYRVEVIVFEHLYSDGDGEVWDKVPGLPDRERLITVSQDATGASGPFYQGLPGSIPPSGIRNNIVRFCTWPGNSRGSAPRVPVMYRCARKRAWPLTAGSRYHC